MKISFALDTHIQSTIADYTNSINNTYIYGDFKNYIAFNLKGLIDILGDKIAIMV